MLVFLIYYVAEGLRLVVGVLDVAAEVRVAELAVRTALALLV